MFATCLARSVSFSPHFTDITMHASLCFVYWRNPKVKPSHTESSLFSALSPLGHGVAQNPSSCRSFVCEINLNRKNTSLPCSFFPSCSGLIWTFISGIAFAVSARVAISLGAGLPSLAKRATKLGLIMALAVECIAALLALAGRRHLAEIFTSAEQVTTSVAAVIPAFALGLLPDGANCVLQGVLRGAGKQSLGAWTTVASYWFIGLPFCYYLAFHRGLQELGLWLGIAATNAVQCIVMLTVITRLDFDAASKTAMRRGALAAIEGRERRNEEERGMSTVPLLEEDSQCT
jgi:hypothetical protein